MDEPIIKTGQYTFGGELQKNRSKSLDKSEKLEVDSKVDEEKLSDTLADMVDRRTRPVTSSVYTARRDLTKKIKLPGDGIYLIVATTFHPDKIGKFYMQTYVERPNYNHDEFENQFYSA